MEICYLHNPLALGRSRMLPFKQTSYKPLLTAHLITFVSKLFCYKQAATTLAVLLAGKNKL